MFGCCQPVLWSGGWQRLEGQIHCRLEQDTRGLARILVLHDLATLIGRLLVDSCQFEGMAVENQCVPGLLYQEDRVVGRHWI